MLCYLILFPILHILTNAPFTLFVYDTFTYSLYVHLRHDRRNHNRFMKGNRVGPAAQAMNVLLDKKAQVQIVCLSLDIISI